MGREPLQIVLYRDSRRGPRVEACQSTISEWYLIIESYEFHQHIADDDDEVSNVAILVGAGHWF